MVAIQIMSDLHLEFPVTYDVFEIQPQAPNLALLGDIGCIKHKKEIAKFLMDQLSQFRRVLYLLGNHEPYGHTWAEAKAFFLSFQLEANKAREEDGKLGEFVFLDRTRYDFDDVTVLGCTLYSHVPEKSMMDVSFGLNDFYQINDWTVEQHNEEHAADLKWLGDELKKSQGSGRKVVVFTHHSPTLDDRAVNQKFKHSKITSGFSTNLEGTEAWRDEQVKLWAFGHTHFNCDFTDKLGKRVYTNQRGYYSGLSEEFDSTKVVEV